MVPTRTDSSPTSPMRVLIVDDHQVTRLGLKMLLAELDPEVRTVETGRLGEAIEIGNRGERFALVSLDVRLPDGNGIERLSRMKEAFQETPIVVMSAEKDRDLIHAAINAGASGYIPKDTENEVTVNAWRLVLAKGVYLPAEALLPGSTPAGSSGTRNAPAEIVLTDGQIDILHRVLLGDSNKVMARRLNMTAGNVKAYLGRLYDKFGVSSRVELMVEAYKRGYFERFTKLPG